LTNKTAHRLINGDARDLSFLPDESIHLVVTSPPYWNLKKESSNLFLNTELIFEKTVAYPSGQLQVCEDQALYEVKSARKSLE
jgi:DNA modification methylase